MGFGSQNGEIWRVKDPKIHTGIMKFGKRDPKLLEFQDPKNSPKNFGGKGGKTAKNGGKIVRKR